MESRRTFLERSREWVAGALAVGALAASPSEAQVPAQTPSKRLKIMMRSGWGTDDPTRGSFVFAHALAFADAGHDVQIFLVSCFPDFSLSLAFPRLVNFPRSY